MAGTSARVFKRDREGNLLDADGHIVPPGDPENFRRDGEGAFVPAGTNPGKAVHLMDIHAEKGMQCADCHFSQDSHGNGFIYGEVANAIEIGCRDCHGTVARLCQPAHLRPGRAAQGQRPRADPQRGRPAPLRMGRARRAAACSIQRSIVDPEPRMGGEPGPRQRRSGLPPCQAAGDQATPGPCFNLRSARAKLMARSGAETGRYRLRPGRARRRPRPSRQRDGLLHLPPQLDDELRRLPPADRGELAHHRPTIMRARRRATSRPTTRRSRATTCSSSAGT